MASGYGLLINGNEKMFNEKIEFKEKTMIKAGTAKTTVYNFMF